MNGTQRDSVLVGLLVAALFAILAVAFGVVLLGCGENASVNAALRAVGL